MSQRSFIVGVLGGMGPLATVAFYRTLVLSTAAARDQDHLHVVIESDPAIPDRTAFLVGKGPDPRPALIAVACRLEQAGASLIVIPCNTANVFRRDISAAVSVPILPWIDIAAAALAQQRPRRVGLLGTTGTLRSQIYQEALAKLNIEALTPGRREQAAVMDTIYGPGGVKWTGSISHDGRSALLAAARSLANAGADHLLLACTELPLAISADDPDWPVPAFDPVMAVADAVIDAAGAQARRDGPLERAG